MSKANTEAASVQDESIFPGFKVVLVDADGNEQCQIGYRYGRPGANAVCENWNRQADREFTAVVLPINSDADDCPAAEIKPEAMPEAIKPAQAKKAKADWSLLLFDGNEVISTVSGLTKRQAWLAWKMWNYEENQSVVVPWPTSMPLPKAAEVSA